MENPNIINTLEKKKQNSHETIRNLEDTIKVLELKFSTVEKKNLSEKAKNKLEKAKNKFIDISKKFLRTVKWVSVIGGGLAVANFERTHSDLKITNNQDGTIEYTHEDAQTTHLLNILAGKENFTIEDVRKELDVYIEEYLSEKNLNTDKEISKMSLQEIDDFFAAHAAEIDTTFRAGDIIDEYNDELRGLNETFTNLDLHGYVVNKKIYELVWQLEQECGNPRIRFTSEKIKFTPVSAYQGSSHYDPINNIIYIDPWSITGGDQRGSDFFSEMSHAKQFNDHQVGSYLQAISDFLKAFKEGGFSGIADSYKDLYKEPGTIENDAHEIIEPYLHNKYKFYKKKDDKNEDK